MDYYVIGDREILQGFSMVGIAGAAVSNREEALAAFKWITGCDNPSTSNASDSRPKILILTETVADLLEEEVVAWQMEAAYPLIVEIPGLQGHIEGRRTLSDAIQGAIGIQA